MTEEHAQTTRAQATHTRRQWRWASLGHDTIQTHFAANQQRVLVPHYEVTLHARPRKNAQGRKIIGAVEDAHGHRMEIAEGDVTLLKGLPDLPEREHFHRYQYVSDRRNEVAALGDFLQQAHEISLQGCDDFGMDGPVLHSFSTRDPLEVYKKDLKRINKEVKHRCDDILQHGPAHPAIDVETSKNAFKALSRRYAGEYLAPRWRNNSRILGTVVQTKDGPGIHVRGYAPTNPYIAHEADVFNAAVEATKQAAQASEGVRGIAPVTNIHEMEYAGKPFREFTRLHR